MYIDIDSYDKINGPIISFVFETKLDAVVWCSIFDEHAEQIQNQRFTDAASALSDLVCIVRNSPTSIDLMLDKADTISFIEGILEMPVDLSTIDKIGKSMGRLVFDDEIQMQKILMDPSKKSVLDYLVADSKEAGVCRIVFRSHASIKALRDTLLDLINSNNVSSANDNGNNTPVSQETVLRLFTDKKDKAEAILNDLGLSLDEGVNIFLAKVVNYNGIPFSISI